jgi:hypothetical protein
MAERVAGGEVGDDVKVAERTLGATNHLWWGAATLAAEMVAGLIVVAYRAMVHNPASRSPLITVMVTVGAVGGACWIVSFWSYFRRVRRVNALGMRCCVACLTEFHGDAEKGKCSGCGRAYTSSSAVDAWMRATGMTEAADKAAAERKAAEKAAEVEVDTGKKSSLFGDI